MNRKVTAVVVVVAAGIVLAATLRTSNRADAAAGNCYTETQGPSEPTICN